MKKFGHELDFISRILRDGSGTTPLTEGELKILQKEEMEVSCLSLTEKTYIALGFNSYVVRIKPAPQMHKLDVSCEQDLWAVTKLLKKLQLNFTLTFDYEKEKYNYRVEFLAMHTETEFYSLLHQHLLTYKHIQETGFRPMAFNDIALE